MRKVIFTIFLRSSWILSVVLIISLTSNLNGQIIWEPIKDVTSPSIAHNWPRISLDGKGEPIVIWGNLERVMFSKWEGTRFSQAIPLNPPGVTVAEAGWMGPEFCTHGDTIYVVYKETPENQDGKHVWCVSSFDNGGSWNDPVRVDQTGSDKVRFPVVTTDKNGHPIVGMMRSNENFHDTRWVVSRSNDHGVSFTVDTLASGWSGQRSEACDCCPGSMDTDGDLVAMFYRDNLFDLRECWASVSYNGGQDFSKGVNVDGTGWMINSCPSSAIDGIILGDSIYSAFMSGASGSSKVYFSRSSLSQNISSVNPIIKEIQGIQSQNYPRIDHFEKAVGAAWVQYSGDRALIPIKFSPDIHSIPMILDTVALGNAENVDIAVAKEKIFVVWKDPNAKAIRYRVGRYNRSSNTNQLLDVSNLTISPNPSKEAWRVFGEFELNKCRVNVLDLNGNKVYERNFDQQGKLDILINNENLPAGIYILDISNSEYRINCLLQKIR